MNRNNKKSLSLQQALQTIVAAANRLPVEMVTLREAEQRITASAVVAAVPQPSFDESSRDGYVIPLEEKSAEYEKCYRLAGEIPAGKPSAHILAPGTACRIMTGGCVPEGSAQVIPFENCIEQNGTLFVDSSMSVKQTFIRKTGSEIALGEEIIAAGTVLQGWHLALLATCGVHSASVVRQPVAGFACTGSELVTGADIEGLGNGQKVSSNSFLLSGLLGSVGARPEDMGVIEDDEQELLNFFNKVRAGRLDVLVTTGGMGPGKYDLVERTFCEAGGKVDFRSLAVRPGKSILFGVLGRTLVFGLPGPPHAVRTLLNVLVGPALLAMQGQSGLPSPSGQAHVQHQIKIKRNGVLRLKDGVLTMEAGRCLVRYAGRLEMGNCFILLPPDKPHYSEGELVEIYLALDQSWRL